MKQDRSTANFGAPTKADGTLNRRDFLRRTSLAALAATTPALAVDPESQAPRGKVLDAHQWRTLAAVQDHLLPSEPGAPGSRDIRATAYLDGVLADPDLAPETRSFVLSGVGWLDELAQDGGGQPFADLVPGVREDLLVRMGQSRSGDRWLSTLIGYTLEALLGDPLYGGNPDGIGWAWLDHNPGLPRPSPQTIYGSLGKERHLGRHPGAPQNLVAGGCRFGKDPASSLLDPDCRAHGVDNLFVSDGSFMPIGGSVPFTWTIYANAFRVADCVVADPGGVRAVPGPAAAGQEGA